MKVKTLSFGSGSFDKITLWSPENPTSGTIFILHGLTEYIGRYEDFARFMTDRGWAVAGFNIPGHGDAVLTVDGEPRRAYCGGEGSWQPVAGEGRFIHTYRCDGSVLWRCWDSPWVLSCPEPG